MVFVILMLIFVMIVSFIFVFRRKLYFLFNININTNTSTKDEIDSGSLNRIVPLLNLVTRFTKKVYLFGYKEKIQKKLIATNLQSSLNADQFIALSVVASLAFLIFIAVLSNFNKLAMVAVCMFGLILPTMQIDSKLKKRHRQLLKDLPYFLDMLTLSVDGGMGPRVAVRKVPCYIKPGPLKTELEVVLHDIENGESEEMSLKKMAIRTDLPEIKDFSAAYSRVTTRGGSIAATLRIQADQMRIRRLQIAEKEGKEASVKMILPIAFCIFPVAVIMLFGPMIVKLVTKGF